MQFTVPQFIERKPKIIGPFTMIQFVYVGVAGGLCLFFYFIVPIQLFVILAILLLGAGLSLAFIKIQKTPLPTVLRNLAIYILSPRIYLWKKKISALRIIRKIRGEDVPGLKKPDNELRANQNSLLSDLSTRVETEFKVKK